MTWIRSDQESTWEVEREVQRRREEIPFQPLAKPGTYRSSPIKEGDALSVVVHLEQENGVLTGTTTIKRENSEVYSVTDATVSFWAVDGKMQIYIALPRLILQTPQPALGSDRELPASGGVM